MQDWRKTALTNWHVCVLMRLAGVSILALVALLCTAAPAALAQDDDGLRVAVSKVFTPNLVEENIQVEATYVLTNERPSEIIDGSRRSFLFTNWVIAIPATATNFVASRDGQALGVTTEEPPRADAGEVTTEVVLATIQLPFNLRFEQTVTLDVSYEVPGSTPRGDRPPARVNQSFLSFAIWTAGDPGLTDVRVAIPDGLTMELQGDLDGLDRVERDGQSILEAVAIESPQTFFGQVFGRNDDGLLTETAQLPGAQATVRAWPDDPEWAEFVVTAIEEDVPIIEDLVGLDWPIGDIEVIESVTPYLYGYGGWFNAASGVIEIGENLDRDLILHELAHAWFNADFIEGRWITEGLAEEFASRALGERLAASPHTGAPTSEPNTSEAIEIWQLDPVEPNLDDPLRVQLSEWASPWALTEEDAFAYEKYHYNASWWVMRQLTDDVGLDAFADVLVALDNNELAYVGQGPIEQALTPPGWTDLFDLLELRAQASNLDELFGTYVLSVDQQGLLTDRRTQREHYRQLQEVSGSWAPPLLVRRELGDWDFAGASDAIDVAEQSIELNASITQLAADLQIVIDDDIESAYETATTAEDLTKVIERQQAQLARLQMLDDQRAELQANANTLGVPLGVGPMSLPEARTGAAQLQRDLDALGDLRRKVDERARSLTLVPPPWPAREQTVDLASATALAEARLATLDAVEQAGKIVHDRPSATERVGLWGRDAEAELNRARSAFEADALDDSLAAAAMVETLVNDAAATGRRRLTFAAIAVVAAALVMTARFVTTRWALPRS